MPEIVKRSVVLTKHIDEFIAQQVEAGRFANHSEAIRAGMRLLEDYETRLRDVRRLIDEADAQIAAGEGIEYSDARSLARDVIERGTARLARDD